MMCLGWNNRSTCKASDPVEIPGTQAAEATANANCPNIGWFWLSLAGIIGYGMVKK